MADFSWVRDQSGQICGIWLRDPGALDRPGLVETLLVMGKNDSLLSDYLAKRYRVVPNSYDASGGCFVMFGSGLAPGEEPVRIAPSRQLATSAGSADHSRRKGTAISGWLRRVPGFRSGSRLKQVTAVIGYALLVGAAAMSPELAPGLALGAVLTVAVIDNSHAEVPWLVGFRSGRGWKKLTASLFYALLVMYVLGSGLPAALTAMSLLAALAVIAKDGRVHSWLPGLRQSAVWPRRIARLGYVAVCALGVVMGLSLTPPTILADMDLTGFDFSGADLTATRYDFTNVNLSQANLTSAVLDGRDLRTTKLGSSILISASLRGANLHGGQLPGADLRGAVADGADLRRANLAGADLSGTNLTHAKLSGADLSGANLDGADLTGVDLSSCNLAKVDLKHTRLDSAVLTGATLDKSDLSGVALARGRLGRAKLRGTNLQRADLTGAVLTGVDLTGADLTDSTLREAQLQWAVASGVKLRGADLTGADLRNLDLSGADIADANIAGSVLDGSKMIDVVGLSDDMLGSVESAEGLRLDSPASIVRTMAAVCSGGNGVAAASPFQTTRSPHGTVVVGPYADGLDHPWNAELPASWQPLAIRWTGLVVCIGPEERTAIEVCRYNGPNVTRYVHRTTVTIRAARTGAVLATKSFKGEPPHQCATRESYYVTEIDGPPATPAFDQVQGWLASFAEK